MQDFTLTDKDSVSRNFHDVIRHGHTVVAHTFDPVSELPHYQYLSSLDANVVLISSRNNPFMYAWINSQFPDMAVYIDTQLDLVSQLKQLWQLEPPEQDLVHLLRFQMLFSDGELQQCWYQPVTDHWQSFLGNRTVVKKFYDQFGTWGFKWLRDQDKTHDVLWTSTTPAGSYSHSYTLSKKTDFFLKFYNLVPNSGLEKILKKD